MPTSADFERTFTRLRELLAPYEQRLVVKGDRPDLYYLHTPHVAQWKKDLLFGGVQIKKNYVAFHLFPIYMYPELLEGMSPELTKRMQGKSCFNFRSIDDAQLRELKRLTKQGFDRFVKERFL